MPRENAFVNAFPEGKRWCTAGKNVSAYQPVSGVGGIRLNLCVTRRTIAGPPADPGNVAAAQEQKQINDLVGVFELSVCITHVACSSRIASPHGDCRRHLAG
jgi:hypothetical protein